MAMTAWRFWTVAPVGHPLLRAPYEGRCVWWTREFKPDCWRGAGTTHRPPNKECGCGVYAVDSAAIVVFAAVAWIAQAARQGSHDGRSLKLPQNWPAVVIGRIKLRNPITGPLGGGPNPKPVPEYFGESAYIDELFVHDPFAGGRSPADLATYLADLYGVRVRRGLPYLTAEDWAAVADRVEGVADARGA